MWQEISCVCGTHPLLIKYTLKLSTKQEQYHNLTTCPRARIQTAKRPTDDLNGYWLLPQGSRVVAYYYEPFFVYL